MKTLRQIQTEAVRIARRKHGANQFSLVIVEELQENLVDLSKNPSHKSKSVELFNNMLRLIDSQGMSGDDMLTMAEQANKIEELKLDQQS